MAVNYNDGKWYGWNGGECPVHPDTVVEVTEPDGTMWRLNAACFNWKSCALLFRVIKEHREPREWDVLVGRNGDVLGSTDWRITSSIAEKRGEYTRVKVREVME